MKTFILLVCLAVLVGCVVTLTFKRKIERIEITIYIVNRRANRHTQKIHLQFRQDGY